MEIKPVARLGAFIRRNSRHEAALKTVSRVAIGVFGVLR